MIEGFDMINNQVNAAKVDSAQVKACDFWSMPVDEILAVIKFSPKPVSRALLKLAKRDRNLN